MPTPPRIHQFLPESSLPNRPPPVPPHALLPHLFPTQDLLIYTPHKHFRLLRLIHILKRQATPTSRTEPAEGFWRAGVLRVQRLGFERGTDTDCGHADVLRDECAAEFATLGALAGAVGSEWPGCVYGEGYGVADCAAETAAGYGLGAGGRHC